MKKNKDKWLRFERLLAEPKQADPDELAHLFLEITDDLSYARTRYPRSLTPKYLNQLAAKVHLAIYRNKKEGWREIKKFWLHDAPIVARRLLFPEIFWATAIFLLSTAIGALSSARDETFVRLILGDQYVETTLKNIQEGNPTGVYQNHDPFQMFLFIAFNNLRVAFLMFAAGLTAGILTFYLLLHNGVMVGSFFYLFWQYGESARAW
ncbi:MAG: stage II sporulation protein M, partial [Bacteroidia bacterium]|nr:stage II sporulation protein M [Bacteroidia bacterium]